MAKPNTYALLLQAQTALREMQVRLPYARAFAVQQTKDLTALALNRAFGFGPKRQAQFREALHEVSLEYADMCLADAAEDRTISYTREKLDRALRQVCGEIQPYEERYDPMNILYTEKEDANENGNSEDQG